MVSYLLDTTTILASLATVLTFACIHYHIKLFTFWSSRGIRGPTPWPFFGTNIHFFFKDRVEVDQIWREKYGHTYGVFEGYTPVLRTTDNNVIKYVWIKNFQAFTDRNAIHIYGDLLSKWMFWSKGDHWASQRALVTPAFTSSRLKTMFITISSCMTKFKQEIGAAFKSRAINNGCESDQSATDKHKQTKTVEKVISKDEMMACFLDIIAQSFFSIKLDTYKDKTSEFYKRAYAFSIFELSYFFLWLLSPRFISRYFQWDISPYSKFEYFDQLGQKMIDERRANPSMARNDFLQCLLDARVPDKYEKVYCEQDNAESHYNDMVSKEELESQLEGQVKRAIFRKFDDIEIRGQMTFFFVAGFETSASTLSFATYELAHQQEVQEELYQELISYPDLAKQMDFSKLLNLKKLDAFLSESMRLYSPVTENNRVVTAKEGVVLPSEPPISLPYGYPISVPAMVVQRDPDYWPDPLKFDMTRFYPENKDKIKSASYMPFGLGPRNCAGMRFALLTVKSALVSLLLSYKISPGPNSSQYPPEFNRHAFFLVLKNTDIKLTPRETAT